jgi:hypothetical protein
MLGSWLLTGAAARLKFAGGLPIRRLRYLCGCSDCYRLERSCRVGFAPTERSCLRTAHMTTSFIRQSRSRRCSWGLTNKSSQLCRRTYF